MNKLEDSVYMKEALIEAGLAMGEGEVPVGAIIVSRTGEIIGRGHNHRESRLDISSHAEIEAMKEASRKLGRWSLEGCTIYVTLEPCLMCSGAILQSRLSRIVYGADDPEEGAIRGKLSVFDNPEAGLRPLITAGVLEEDAKTLLQTFFSLKRNRK